MRQHSSVNANLHFTLLTTRLSASRSHHLHARSISSTTLQVDTVYKCVGMESCLSCNVTMEIWKMAMDAAPIAKLRLTLVVCTEIPLLPAYAHTADKLTFS